MRSLKDRKWRVLLPFFFSYAGILHSKWQKKNSNLQHFVWNYIFHDFFFISLNQIFLGFNRQVVFFFLFFSLIGNDKIQQTIEKQPSKVCVGGLVTLTFICPAKTKTLVMAKAELAMAFIAI